MTDVASLGVCSSARTCVGDFILRLLEAVPPLYSLSCRTEQFLPIAPLYMRVVA